MGNGGAPKPRASTARWAAGWAAERWVAQHLVAQRFSAAIMLFLRGGFSR